MSKKLKLKFLKIYRKRTYELFQQKADEMNKKYEEINVKLTTTPVREDKLMELKDILQKYPGTLLDMQRDISQLEKVMRLLENFSFKIEVTVDKKRIIIF